MHTYDYLVVGAGLYGAVFTHEAIRAGKRVLVLERRPHIGGNIYTQEESGIVVHRYGAHIFHTSNRAVWDYIRQFAEFNHYVNCPVANYQGKMYNLPFNMNTFAAMWGVRTPSEARAMIDKQVREAGIEVPTNLEEQAISMVGRDIYEKLIKGYTAKQWGRPCTELPPSIIRRLPVRYVYDNNYFNDLYQGIPIGGYTPIIEKMLAGADVLTDTDFLADRAKWEAKAEKVLFTGMIDAYYDECYGALEYRGLAFENETLDMENYQGCAVVNYTEYEVPYTRIIEHKHFEFGCQTAKSNPKTIITREYPAPYRAGEEPYYPVNDDKNNQLFSLYRARADKEKKVIFGGRLGLYRYLDMHVVIEEALAEAARLI